VLHLNGNPLCDDDHYIASVATHTEVTELDGEIITKNAAMGLISEKKADDADGAILQARGAYESRMEFERRKMDMRLKTLHAEELEMLTSFNAYVQAWPPSSLLPCLVQIRITRGSCSVARPYMYELKD